MKYNTAVEEKAKDFAGYNTPSSQDIVTSAKMNGKYEGFKAGAEWMFKKMSEFMKHQYVDWGE